MTFQGVNPLIHSIEVNPLLKKGLRILDLSFNKVGEQGVNKIINYINTGDCNLEEVNLEGNSLGDDNVNKLCETINNSLGHKITAINISRNLITDNSCYNIANLLYRCPMLKILMISWNHIKNFGASLIINKLKKNFEMKVFDISWNSIGTNLNNEPALDQLTKNSKPDRNFMNFEINEFRTSMSVTFRKELMPPKEAKNAKGGSTANSNKDNKTSKNANQNTTSNKKDFKSFTVSGISKDGINMKLITPFAKELGEYFREVNTQLVHLDISHNNISCEDATYLEQECKTNHKILGIHVDGNEMYIDALGFIHPLKKASKVANYYATSQIYYNINRNQNFVRTNNEKIKKIRAKNNCWICEGWREITFSFSAYKMKDADKQFVKLHLNFEDWKPCDTMLFDKSFRAVRMCPPGDVLYFFTVNKKPVEDYGVHNFSLREPQIYTFDNEYIKEYNENELKNHYFTKQNEINSKDAVEFTNLESPIKKPIEEDIFGEADGDELNKSSMSYRSNITQVMGDIREVNKYLIHKFF